MALAGDDEVRPLQALAQADQAGHEVEAGLNAGAQGDQASRQPARRAATGHAGDVDARLAAVARGHRRRGAGRARATCAAVAPFCGPKTAAASPKRVVTSQATTSSIPPQCGGRTDGLVGAQAAVGRGGPAAADHDAPGARVAGGQEELADAGRAGAHRVVAPRPREQGTARGTRHLDDGGQGLAVARSSEQAPLGLDPGAERACDDGRRAGFPPAPAAGLRRRPTWGPRRRSTRPPGRLRPWRRPPRRLRPCPGICPARRRDGAREGSYRVQLTDRSR